MAVPIPGKSAGVARLVGLAVLIVALITVAVLAPKIGKGVGYKPNPFDAAGEVLAGLFVVALFMERSLAVINGLWASTPERLAEADLVSAAAAGESLTSPLQRIGELEALKTKIRLAVGFVFGLLVSAAGARTLEGLLTVPLVTPQAPWPNANLFRAVDIILTAGLLAGGSNGLAALIDIIKAQARLFILQVKAAWKAPGT